MFPDEKNTPGAELPDIGGSDLPDIGETETPWDDEGTSDPFDLESGHDGEDVGFALEGDEEMIEATPRVEMIGRVAVVGYPNVGKSTLVNRLSGSRTAIVHEQPGVTRDRKEIPCEWNGAHFMLIDTGGVDIGDPRPMARQIIEQAKIAIAESDIVLLVVDAMMGMSAADLELAEILRTSRVPVRVVANKIDNYKRESHAAEFYGLGLGDPIAVSAHHGNNTGDLLDEVVAFLQENGTKFGSTFDESRVRVAVLGRPNVGKSTLINAIIGNDRVIVSEVAGTTRDSIDTAINYEEHEIILVDTAGLRRRKKEREAVEYYGEVRSLQAADRADIALVLVDAQRGLTDSDIVIADEARQRNCATLIVLAKWDISTIDLGDVQATLQEKLRQRPELITVSSLTGRNVQKVLSRVLELHKRYAQKISTSDLNEALTEIKELVNPPADKRSRRRLNILYGTQIQVAPPRFRVYVNDRKLLTRNYGYYIENRLREKFNFEGCPLIIDYQSRR